ncbi:glutamate racemase [Vibrio sp. ZSDZ34]|uniref:Glutamate racemase n=1 Tax=Vibrio gelatinilyticus TaxID=2893468 RepID=A0A9X1WIC2_9VIBR|nr:glutamate racemase [Vibrio gelatinilyticus]MCJ2378705.1 glutamate racemase [Vibrio gelatinilyticus]
MQKQSTNKTVLIFDSGIGGLSVQQEIQLLLPDINVVYLFDNEAYPYGELEPSELINRTSRLVSQMVEQRHIDIVVIACNTASTIVLPTLRAELTIPVVGVVPAVKPASQLSTQALAIIATPATVKREYTHDLIRDFAIDKDVKLLGSTRLVEIAEEKLRGIAVDLSELEDILLPLIGKVDTAVLGCTHFPLIRREIGRVLGDRVKLVDSGEAIARRVRELLGESRLNSNVCYEAFCSAPPFKEDALNSMIKNYGFASVNLFPIQDASDR